MEKRQLIELVQRDLCGGTPTADQLDIYHPKLIEAKIQLVWNSFIAAMVEKNLSNLEGFAKEYTNNGAGIAVEYDSYYKYHYSTLPVGVVSVSKYPTASVVWIDGLKSREVRFVPSTKTQSGVLRELEVWKYDDRVPYTLLKPVTIIYEKDPTPTKLVKMGLVVGFDNYDNTDQITIPEGQDVMLYEMIKKMFAGLPVADMNNDNNAKQV